MDEDGPRAVQADRSGADLIPIEAPEEERDEPWRPGLDYVGPDGKITRRPVELRNTIFDPAAQIAPAPEPEPAPPPPAPTGGEMQRVMRRAFPGTLVGGQAQRPILQELPKTLPATRRELHEEEPAPDDQTRAIIWMMARWSLLGVGFVALMVWLNLSGRL